MLKQKHGVHFFVLLLLSAALLITCACKPDAPAVPEAPAEEPAADALPAVETAFRLSLALPEDAVQGDLLVAQICYSGGVDIVVLPPSSDWAAIEQTMHEGKLASVSFYKRMERNSERKTPVIFTLSGSTAETTQRTAVGKIIWVRGIDPADPVYANAGMAGSGTNLRAQGVEAEEPCVFVTLFSVSGNGQGLTLSGDMQQMNALYNELVGGFVLCAAEQRFPAGASADFSATAGDTGAWITQTIAFRLAPVDVVFRAGAHGALTSARLSSVTVSVRGSINVADIPSVYTESGYYFTGWKAVFNASRLDASGVCGLDVSNGVTLTAQYQRSEYTVRFVLGDHGNSKDPLVFSDLHRGDSIKVPGVSAVSGWTFTGWDTTPVTKVQANATYTAQYTQNTYAVTFVVGTHGSSSDTLAWTGLHDGDTISIPSITAGTGWTFTGWDTTPVTTVHGNTTYTAQYTQNEYDVTFLLGEHGTSADTLVFSDVHYGDTISIPAVEANTGWVFTGWNTEPSETVVGNATYTAQYEQSGYQVSFVLGEHGFSEDTLVFSGLEDGDMISVPFVAAEEGWNFDGWDVSPETTVYGDATYTALYSPVTYTVVFILGPYATTDDQVVFTDLQIGDTITIPSFTLPEGYLYLGWSPTPSTTVSGDAEYVLLYSRAPIK